VLEHADLGQRSARRDDGLRRRHQDRHGNLAHAEQPDQIQKLVTLVAVASRARAGAA
jgi:hypothetical protein